MAVDIEQTEVPEQLVAFVRRTVPMADLGEFFPASFGAVMAAVGDAGGAPCGPPFGWYHGMPGDTVDVAAGFPVEGVEPGRRGDDGVEVALRPGGNAVVALHVGPFDDLAATYEEVMPQIVERGLTLREDMWEEYLTDPEQSPDPATWQTRLVLPVTG